MSHINTCSAQVFRRAGVTDEANRPGELGVMPSARYVVLLDFCRATAK
jgi:hypothetical protein